MFETTERRFGALELGGSKALCAVFRGEHVVAERRVPTTCPDETLQAVITFFRDQGALDAVGIASFGPLELDRESKNFGAMLRTPKPGWSDVPIAGAIADALRVPVEIDTDVNAAALAEQQRGAGEGADPLVYITVGTGVGVGVRMNGRPLHGLMHPELGHLRVPDFCDFPGSCPFHGRCVEGVASAPALAKRYGKAPAELGDDDAIWALEARYLAHLLATCVLAYAPRCIVLGGGVLERTGLRERVREQLVAQLAGYVPRSALTMEGVAGYVRAPRFEQRAGLIGASLLAAGACS